MGGNISMSQAALWAERVRRLRLHFDDTEHGGKRKDELREQLRADAQALASLKLPNGR